RQAGGRFVGDRHLSRRRLSRQALVIRGRRRSRSRALPQRVGGYGIESGTESFRDARRVQPSLTSRSALLPAEPSGASRRVAGGVLQGSRRTAARLPAVAGTAAADARGTAVSRRRGAALPRLHRIRQLHVVALYQSVPSARRNRPGERLARAAAGCLRRTRAQCARLLVAAPEKSRKYHSHFQERGGERIRSQYLSLSRER